MDHRRGLRPSPRPVAPTRGGGHGGAPRAPRVIRRRPPHPSLAGRPSLATPTIPSSSPRGLSAEPRSGSRRESLVVEALRAHGPNLTIPTCGPSRRRVRVTDATQCQLDLTDTERHGLDNLAARSASPAQASSPSSSNGPSPHPDGARLGVRPGVARFSPHDLRRSFVSDLLDVGSTLHQDLLDQAEVID